MFRFSNRPFFVTLSYVLLLIVMGGRSALFVANFDTLVQFGELTVLAILFAIALAFAVPAGAYVRAREPKNSNAHKIGGWVVIGAAVTDGAFNISEAILLATESGVFTGYSGIVLYWLYFTLLLVGLAPTLLTIGLASLAGSLARKAPQRTRTRVAVAVEHVVEDNPALDAHWSSIRKSIQPGESFQRPQIEALTGVGKNQALNIINYGRDKGFVDTVARGQYVYNGGDDDG